MLTRAFKSNLGLFFNKIIINECDCGDNIEIDGIFE